jgi:GT2 family glycosyltransferase
MDKPKIAFVIVGWNNHDLLSGCIESIRSQTYKNIKIIYVDNASSDKSAEFVKRKFAEADIIELKENTGFAKGNNIGIKRALEDEEVKYVALLNTDATLSENWTENIVDFAQLRRVLLFRPSRLIITITTSLTRHIST